MSGKFDNILITRSRESARKSFLQLESLVERVIYFPTIVTEAIELSSETSNLLKNVSDYDYLIFTSANGVKFFSNIIKEINKPINGRLRVAAVGNKTARAVESYGLGVDIIPEKYSAEGLLEALNGEEISGKKILIPASENSRETLKKGLHERGADVDFIPIYKSVTRIVSEDDEDFKIIKADKPEIFVFTSPSSVRGFIEIFSIENPSEFFGDSILIGIGDVTEQYLSKLKLINMLTPEKFTLEGIADLVKSLILSEGRNI